jgi:hypothetical protein
MSASGTVSAASSGAVEAASVTSSRALAAVAEMRPYGPARWGSGPAPRKNFWKRRGPTAAPARPRIGVWEHRACGGRT